ncbi:MAG: hypothetical protein LAP38_12280 [Acidobacteriia bacterium]|nr:hypothetical protein [Terriglobia bacterium]
MRRTIAALFLFGISFGYLEAAVVVYLRAIYDPIRQHLHPDRAPNQLFPLITPQQLADAGPDNPRRLAIELGREAATMAMLAAIALACGRNFQERVAAFAVAFGIWDIAFYAFLRLMIHWPDSLATWDILFLIPLPWVGPVWAPVLVAFSMVVCGLVVLGSNGLQAGPLHWLSVLVGALVIVLSFVWDYRNITAGGMPNPFNWPLFLAGEAIGLIGFFAAVRNRGYPESQKPRGSGSPTRSPESA